jgi:hypothetical protein
MRPDDVLKICYANEAAGVPSFKAQSPSTLGWRLRVEARHTFSFESAVRSGTQLRLMDSRRYRETLAILKSTRLTAAGPLPSGETHRVVLPMQADVRNDVARGNLLAYSLRPEKVSNEGESLH